MAKPFPACYREGESKACHGGGDNCKVAYNHTA